MSLKKCPHCKKEAGFWEVYWDVNKKHCKNLTCRKCGKNLEFKKTCSTKGKCSVAKKVLSGLAWMLFPLLLMFLVVTSQMNFLYAIFLVIIYHFIAMYVFIEYYSYKK